MPKDRDFDFEDVLPESWTDALQEFVGTFSSSLRLSLINPTTVRASHGANSAEEQVGVGVAGLWRWRTSPYDVAVSGGAGTKDIFVVAPTANKFTGNKDETERAWELRVVPGGETPAGVAAYRKIGEVAWSGTEVTALAQLGPESVNGPQIRSNALSNNGDISWSREASGAWVPQLKADSVGANEVAPGVIGDSEVADALKPSKGAAAGTEALRAIGATASTVVAGNDARLTDERTPKDNSVTSTKIVNATIKKEDLATEARNIAWYRNVDLTEDLFFEQTTYKFMDSVSGIVLPANALVLVSYSALHRGGAGGATHYAAIFFNEIQLKVPANNTQATPTAQEVSYVAGANFSTSYTFLYTTPWGLVTPGVNTSGTEVARVEGEAISATAVGGGFVLVRGLAAGTYEIGIKLKSSSNYSRVKYRNLQIGVCAPGA